MQEKVLGKPNTRVFDGTRLRILGRYGFLGSNEANKTIGKGHNPVADTLRNCFNTVRDRVSSDK
jgi:hypothetical protein